MTSLNARLGSSGRFGAPLWSLGGALIVAVSLSAASLVSGWAGAPSSGSAIAGILPFSDASAYYHCAAVLNEGASLRTTASGAFCSRRPLFTAALAGALGMTGGDLRLALLILASAAAFACLTAAAAFRQSEGLPAATLLFAVSWLFYRPLLGTTLTEHLGVALGAAGFALLWSSAAGPRPTAGVCGLFFVSAAENARAGALLVLPALALWLAWGGPARAFWRRLWPAMAAVVMAFAINAALTRAIGVPGAAFSNYSYHLYGIVHGSDYRQALRDHPELAGLADADRSRAIYRLAWQRLEAEPTSIARGAMRAWSVFLFRPYVFRFLPRAVDLALRVMAAAGLALCAARRGDRRCSLLLVAAAATLASVPLLPPWDVSVRAYAATFPFVAALPAVLLSPSVRVGQSRAADGSSGAVRAWTAATIGALAVGTLLLAFTLSAPPILRLLRRPLGGAAPTAPCSDAVQARLQPGATVTVVSNDSPAFPWNLEVRQREFREGLAGLRADFPGMAAELSRVRAPFLLTNAVTFSPPLSRWLVVPAHVVEPGWADGRVLDLCLAPAQDPGAREQGLAYVTGADAAQRER